MGSWKKFKKETGEKIKKFFRVVGIAIGILVLVRVLWAVIKKIRIISLNKEIGRLRGELGISAPT